MRLDNQDFQLIGYFGATLALLLAERHTDTASLQTLANNLSPQCWTQQKLQLTPLQDSLKPDLHSPRLAECWTARAEKLRRVSPATGHQPPAYRIKAHQLSWLQFARLPAPVPSYMQ